LGWDAVDATASSRQAVAGRISGSRERSSGAWTNDVASGFTNVLQDVHMPQNLLMEMGRVRLNRVVLAPVAGVKLAEICEAQPGVRRIANLSATVTRRIRRRGATVLLVDL
jgi:hypothetical protein